MNNFGNTVETTATATTTAAEKLGANANRISLLIYNQGAVNVQCSFTDDTAATKYFVIAAGAFSPLFQGVQAAVYAKSVSSTAVLYFLEVAG